MKTVFYVSTKSAAALADPGHMADIVATAQARNGPLEVSGALLSAGPYFAQVLEGPNAGVDAVIDSIRHDRRHQDILVLRDEAIERRAFSAWNLAYLGEATYVASLVEAVIREPQSRPYADRIVRFMREFARDERPVRPWGRGLSARASGVIRPS